MSGVTTIFASSVQTTPQLKTQPRIRQHNKVSFVIINESYYLYSVYGNSLKYLQEGSSESCAVGCATFGN
jgi:RAB protein geranylgeranyltransferase component A